MVLNQGSKQGDGNEMPGVSRGWEREGAGGGGEEREKENRFKIKKKCHSRAK